MADENTQLKIAMQRRSELLATALESAKDNGGVWLNGGRLWHITWTQGTDSTFVFYDADGRPLSICAGRSYIAMVSSVTGQELTVLDSAGQNALN